METEYLNAPGGLSGNDDAGQMSAWFFCFRFTQYVQVHPYYIMASPSFPKAVIHLENGQTFTPYRRKCLQRKHLYSKRNIERKNLFQKLYFYRDIIHGGKMIFQMGNTPEQKLGEILL